VRITDDLRDALTPHLILKSRRAALPSGRKPPTAVYAIVAALVKPESIEASIVDVTSDKQRTRWTVFLVTSAAFAEIRLSFDAEAYDESEEKALFARKQKVAINVERAQVDQLWGVVKVEFVRYVKESDITIDQTNQDWLPLPRMKLTFADKRELYIPGQRGVKSQELAESDNFLAAIRNHLPF
jgi:hypothetical protein